MRNRATWLAILIVTAILLAMWAMHYPTATVADAGKSIAAESDARLNGAYRFELGLKHHSVERTKDGYFVGSNFASDPKVLKEETNFDPHNPESSPNGRRARWMQLMEENKGKIDVAMAERFLGDHFDSYLKKEIPNERSLCGHLELSPRGESVWDSPPYSPDGAVQGKAMDSRMAKDLSFRARYGHPCGKDFLVEPFLKGRPEFNWQAGVLRDMKAGPWTLLRTGERE